MSKLLVALIAASFATVAGAQAGATKQEKQQTVQSVTQQAAQSTTAQGEAKDVAKAKTEKGTPKAATFCLSQRAEHIWEGVSSPTPRSRPIINPRDEPHADPEQYRRLGDAFLREKKGREAYFGPGGLHEAFDRVKETARRYNGNVLIGVLLGRR